MYRSGTGLGRAEHEPAFMQGPSDDGGSVVGCGTSCRSARMRTFSTSARAGVVNLSVPSSPRWRALAVRSWMVRVWFSQV